MVKKGQITIFIAIAIVILVISAIALYARNYYLKKSVGEQGPLIMTDSKKKSQIKDFASQEVRNQLELNLNLNNVNDFTKTMATDSKCQSLDIYYAYCEGKIIELDRQKINEELKKYVLNYLSNMKINFPEIASDCTLKPQSATVVMENEPDYQLYRVSNIGVECTGFKDSFDADAKVSTPFNKVIDVASLIIQKQLEDTTRVPTSYLIDLGDQNNVKITLRPLDENTLVYHISELREDNPVEFDVAVRL